MEAVCLNADFYPLLKNSEEERSSAASSFTVIKLNLTINMSIYWLNRQGETLSVLLRPMISVRCILGTSGKYFAFFPAWRQRISQQNRYVYYSDKGIYYFHHSSEPSIHGAYNKDYIVFYDFERLSKYLQICMTKMEIRAIKHFIAFKLDCFKCPHILVR